MRIVSYKTLKTNKKIRLNYAYRAIERDSIGDVTERQVKAQIAMNTLHKLNKSELLEWAMTEIEYLELTT